MSFGAGLNEDEFLPPWPSPALAFLFLFSLSRGTKRHKKGSLCHEAKKGKIQERATGKWKVSCHSGKKAQKAFFLVLFPFSARQQKRR